MTPEQLTFVAGTCVVAVHFLSWCGLLFASRRCPEDHPWKPRGAAPKKASKKNLKHPRKVEGCNFVCFHRPDSPNKPGRPWDRKSLKQREKQCLKKSKILLSAGWLHTTFSFSKQTDQNLVLVFAKGAPATGAELAWGGSWHRAISVQCDPQIFMSLAHSAAATTSWRRRLCSCH